MQYRRVVTLLAACASLGCPGVARAQTTGSTGANQDWLAHPVFMQATIPATAPEPVPTPSRPLMGLLDAAGVGSPLEDQDITISGYVDGGYTVSANGGSSRVPLAGREFDTKNNRVVLDQFNLYFDRPVDYAKAAAEHAIDTGAHLELIFGWDVGLLHSNGLFDNTATLGVTQGYYRSRASPENQFDFNQAYIDLGLPVGSGLRVRIGKFFSLLSYESINSALNPFYSHTYLFSFAIPFYGTGVLSEYKFSDDWLLDIGTTRGWNQSINDNNGELDFLGGITWTPQESDALKKWKFVLNLSEGPEGTHDNHDWWTVVDLIAIYAATDKLSVALNADIGDAPHAAGVTGAARWYGVAGYGAYVMNDYLTVNLRGEYYGDSTGFTLGAAGLQNLLEVTLNLQVKPFPANTVLQNLQFRPEIRCDYSDRNFFKGGTRHEQITFGVDALFVF